MFNPLHINCVYIPLRALCIYLLGYDYSFKAVLRSFVSVCVHLFMYCVHVNTCICTCAFCVLVLLLHVHCIRMRNVYINYTVAAE